MELLHFLNNPPRTFSPIPFWFLNGDLTDGEIRRQLRDFDAHGVHGAVLHPRIGLRRDIAYLSDEFFRYISVAVEEVAKLDMQIVLYDEGMYPSGSASGLVVKDRPDLASRGVMLVDAPQPGDNVLCETEKGALVERFSGGTIRGIHFGEDDGEPFAPKSADILNPEAVARFILLTHEAYYQRLAKYFGKTIIGFFTDEPSILGRNAPRGMMPWTKGFDKIFTAAGGNLAGLAALFAGGENDDTRLYHRLILEREGHVYYESLSRWCEAHGIFLMGHPHQSDDIEVQRFFHVPGQDLVFRWVSPETGGTAGMDSTMAKCSADAARLMRRKRNSNECFGACNRNGNPWHFTGDDMKWFIDYLAVRGVNMFIPHAFYYSLEGQRSGERPPDVGPGSNWWPRYKTWSAYMARLSFLMTDADLHADVAVLCKNRDLRAETVAPLFETQRGFQYLPESVWGECREENGALVCRGRCYRAVLGEADMFPSVPHDADAVAPDCLVSPAQKDLRVARFTRCGVECWLLVNEGEDDISFMLSLPTDKPIGLYDLWTGEARRTLAPLENGARVMPMALRRRQSALLFACDEADALPLPVQAKVLPTPRFELVAENTAAVTKTYAATLSMNKPPRVPAVMTLDAEEMAELTVNGVDCGASFWPPHRFVIPAGALHAGENDIRLIVTGSLANKYGKEPVFYGMKQP